MTNGAKRRAARAKRDQQHVSSEQNPDNQQGNISASSSQVPDRSVGTQKQATAQPQVNVSASSSTLPARTVEQYECQEPKYLQTTGKFTRHDPGTPSHRDTAGNTSQAVQAPEFKYIDTEEPYFDLHNTSRFCKDQDSARIQSQRESARRADSSASHDHHTIRPELVSDPKTEVKIITNHFKVAIPADQVLYEYRVEGIPEKASRSKRKMIILDTIEINPDLYAVRDTIATDYKHKIISSAPLFGMDEPTPKLHVAPININYFEPDNRDNSPRQIELGIFFSAKYEFDGLRGFVEGRDELYRDIDAKEALNIVIAKAVVDPVNNGDTFQAGDNRFFYRSAWKDLHRLHEYFEALTRKHRALERVPYDDLEVLKRHLRGLRVAVNFYRSNVHGQGPELNDVARRTKTICDLGNVSEMQTFRHGNDAAVNVWKHLHSKYANAKLLKNNETGAVDRAVDRAVDGADKKLPTVNIGQLKKNQKFYLPRQRDVRSDQLYRGQLSPEQTKAMIDIAKRLLEFHYQAILNEGLKSLRLLPNQAKSPITTNLGMQITPQLLELTARVIQKPSCLY